MSIAYWYYDDGKGYKPRKPAWRCMCYTRFKISSSIKQWLENNANDNAEWIVRFNSGDPALFIEIYDKDLATAFRLAWVDN